MRTVDNLADALTEKGVVCISIRAPKGDVGWIANTRVDDNGWKCGEPKPTLEEAILSVLWISNAEPAQADDMEDLLG